MSFPRFLLVGVVGACLAVSAESFETAEIQSRIDAVAASGGGTVTVAKGDHHVGSLELKSGVTLELSEGCRLVASTNYLDYATGKGRSRAVVWSSGAMISPAGRLLPNLRTSTPNLPAGMSIARKYFHSQVQGLRK